MPNSDFTNLRQEERKEVSFATTISIGDMTKECAILDISAGGAKLKTRASGDANTPIVLNLERFGEFNGVIAWARGGNLGIKFTDDPTRLAEAVMAMAMYGAG